MTSLFTPITTLIMDRVLSLVMEIKDDSKKTVKGWQPILTVNQLCLPMCSTYTDRTFSNTHIGDTFLLSIGFGMGSFECL